MKAKGPTDLSGRAKPEELARHINMAISNPAIKGVLDIVGGIVIVLNDYRQIVAMNDSFQSFLGALDASTDVLGLRAGEAVGCVYADVSPRGCGEGEFCQTCGAIISVLTAQRTREVSERKVALRVSDEGDARDMCFNVRSFPVEYEGVLFVVVFMQDITDEERQYGFDRAFYHDIMNTSNGLIGACRLLEDEKITRDEMLEYTTLIRKMSKLLSAEIRIQQAFSRSGDLSIPRSNSNVPLRGILSDIVKYASYHAAAYGRRLVLVDPLPEGTLYTDECLLSRVLLNMLVNACEASGEGDEVRMWAVQEGDSLRINVWNRGVISEKVALRVFQRHFSTKEGNGRGLGTYALKLIGEEVLGGKVGFSSDEDEGTTFFIDLPV